jgi:hypothetical protein
MPRLVAALLAAVLAAAALAACGGGDSGASESSSTSTARQPTGKGGGTKQGEGESTEKSQESKGSGGSSGSPGSGAGSVATPLKVSGGGSTQYRTKGGDNSIQEYGEEGKESELQQAAEAVHGFYVARGEEDWARACSYLAKQVVSQLETLASRSPKLKGKGCAVILHALTSPLPPSVKREMTLVDAGSLRHEGETGFLIYRGAEKKVYAITLHQEDGAWLVASLGATPLG